MRIDLEQLGTYSLQDIKLAYSEHLQKLGYAKSTITTSLTTAFFLFHTDPPGSIWEMMAADDYKKLARRRIAEVLAMRSLSQTPHSIGSYVWHFVQLRKFLFFNGEPELNRIMKPQTSRTPKREHRKRVKHTLPPPSIAVVRRYQQKWAALPGYPTQEDALDKLFRRYSPNNTDIADVLLKVAALNAFYSTNIFSMVPVAKRILSLRIDDRLAVGDLMLVEDMKNVTMRDRTKQLYSFASKYCSHHRPDVYPIYDRYVDQVLCRFRDTDAFAVFEKNELKYYPRFVNVLRQFQQHFGLQEFSLKELDRYLWLLGKENFDRFSRKSSKQDKDTKNVSQ